MFVTDRCTGGAQRGWCPVNTEENRAESSATPMTQLADGDHGWTSGPASDGWQLNRTRMDDGCSSVPEIACAYSEMCTCLHDICVLINETSGQQEPTADM